MIQPRKERKFFSVIIAGGVFLAVGSVLFVPLIFSHSFISQAATFQIVINNNEQYTSSRQVTLTFRASSTTETVILSNTYNFNYSVIGPYKASQQWTLSSGEGVKSVYAKFCGKSGCSSTIFSDTIIYQKVLDSSPSDISNPSSPSDSCLNFTFSRNLYLGMSNKDVQCLKTLLNKDPDTILSGSGQGSAGRETTYFGVLTKAAVIKFQNKYKTVISQTAGYTIQATGFVGRGTRVKLNSLLSEPPPSDLFVSLTASINSSNWQDILSGTNSLAGVDLKADVTGTATGNISYYFDCQNDGVWDSPDNALYKGIASPVKEFIDGCSYLTPGTYAAKVKVERGTAAPAYDTVGINVSQSVTCGDGTCDNNETCSSCVQDCGSCPPICGDGSCNGSEICSTCSGDCGACAPVCGDGSCNGSESCSTCPGDCGACAPICGDGSCSGNEDCSSCTLDCGQCPSQIGSIITYWGPFLDASVITPAVWQDFLAVMESLKDIGFTHNGVAVYSIQAVFDNPTKKALIQQRISEIRAIGLPLAIRISSGHLILDHPLNLDGTNHASNGQDLKYYDSPGFDPLLNAYCPTGGPATSCPGPLQPYFAIDPAYDGKIWQDELALLNTLLDITSLQNNDIVLFDNEVWTYPEVGVDWEHKGTIGSSAGRYTGTLAERYAQYDQFWLARGHDLRDTVKTRNPNARVYFYNENLNLEPNLWSYMLEGSGDAVSPSWESFPVLSKFETNLAKGDYSGSYPWLDFVDAYGAGRGVEKWDPKITQKVGYMLKQEGVSGMFEYPGPFGRENYPTTDYLEQAEAFIKGFVVGIDPGLLVEICGDSMDNDGDGLIDENC